MKKRIPRSLFHKFNSLLELHGIINKFNTSDANKAYDEKMKKEEGAPWTEGDATPEVKATPEAKTTPEGEINSSSDSKAVGVVVNVGSY